MTVGSKDPARILPKGAPIPHSTDFILLKHHMLEACAPLEGSESFVLHAFFSFLKAPKLLPLLQCFATQEGLGLAWGSSVQSEGLK